MLQQPTAVGPNELNCCLLKCPKSAKKKQCPQRHFIVYLRHLGPGHLIVLSKLLDNEEGDFTSSYKIHQFHSLSL